MPNRRLLCKTLFSLSFFFISIQLSAQVTPSVLSPQNIDRCYTQKAIEEAIRKNPGIVEEWRKKGESQYRKFLERSAMGKGKLADTIVIPVVFHLIDEAAKLAWITDRSVYDQVEILNEAYNGIKGEKYKNVIPEGIYTRKGNIPIRFVLARKAPDGTLTSGIERRTNATPDRIGIKAYATGGLDAWDTEKYLNIWVGTFTGDDDGLLGIATFPFITSEGPQGVVVGIATMPYTSNVSRSYYPVYSEGGTLVHEVGHFFYLWHTFGDLSYCNNEDFRIQAGWPLPNGAGPEGDDTPEEKKNDNTIYGNPSMNFSDGCTTLTIGEMYGNFMNYFDDRALFMFSNGQQKRVEGCIQLYRASLANSDAAMAPVSINDAYVVSVSPYGSPERRAFIRNNVPLTVKVRNYGNTVLNTVKLNLSIDGTLTFQQNYPVNLLPGKDVELNMGPINAAEGRRILTIYTSDPNGGTDSFTANDTLQSFTEVTNAVMTAPYTEDFNGTVFPPAGWKIWNPNNDITWARSATSGFTEAGSATLQFRNFSGSGQLDDLLMPALDMGSADSSILSFRYAYAAYNNQIVSTWDGLEVYVSNDNGKEYHLVNKKTGSFLKSVNNNQTTSFEATPATPEKWALEKINLSPYLNGNPLLIKFRGVNARGNNLYLDDVNVSIVVALNREIQAMAITGLPEYVCGDMPAPSFSFRSNGKDIIENLTVNYQLNNGQVSQKSWTGSLKPNNTTSYSFPALPDLAPGEYVFKVYTSKPNGQADEFPSNDTIKTRFYVMGKTTSPLSESFENPEFPPDQWVLQQNGNGHSWERTILSATNGMASATINNFQYDMFGKTDNLISPIISGNSSYDSLFISFDYAYAPGSNYPSGPGTLEDTLEVKVTTDCGQSFTSIFKRFGNEMATVSDPDARKSSPFIAGKDDWQKIKVYLTPVTDKSDLQVFFSAKGNHRNNVYIDNVQVYGIVVPPLLKEKGYLIYPSPFRDQFIIRNYEQPVTLQSVQIYSSTGRLVWQQQYNGQAYKQIFVNASGWERGIYILKLNYTNKTIIDRVVKQ